MFLSGICLAHIEREMVEPTKVLHYIWFAMESIASSAITENLKFLQQADIDHVNYSSHSLRVGATTTAAAAAAVLSPWLSKALQKWCNDAYLAYIGCLIRFIHKFRRFWLAQMPATSHHGILTCDYNYNC